MHETIKALVAMSACLLAWGIMVRAMGPVDPLIGAGCAAGAGLLLCICRLAQFARERGDA